MRRLILLAVSGCLLLTHTVTTLTETPQRTEKRQGYYWCAAPYGYRLARVTSFRIEGVEHEVGDTDETMWASGIPKEEWGY